MEGGGINAAKGSKIQNITQKLVVPLRTEELHEENIAIRLELNFCVRKHFYTRKEGGG